MDIFWRLVFGHFLADYTFQTNFIAAWKRRNHWGLLVHCATHPLMYVLLTWPYLGETWFRLGPVELSGWGSILSIFVIHYLEDWWRVTEVMKKGAPDNTLYLLLDQGIHMLSIFVFIPLWATRGGLLFPEAWPLIGIFLVVVTHAGTVFIYFIEKDLMGEGYPGFDVKYFGMGERLVVFLLFLTAPGALAYLFTSLWMSFMAWVRYKRILDMSWSSYGLGAALAVGCGMMARML